jgi:hypothetical protein
MHCLWQIGRIVRMHNHEQLPNDWTLGEDCVAVDVRIPEANFRLRFHVKPRPASGQK